MAGLTMSTPPSLACRPGELPHVASLLVVPEHVRSRRRRLGVDSVRADVAQPDERARGQVVGVPDERLGPRERERAVAELRSQSMLPGPDRHAVTRRPDRSLTTMCAEASAPRPHISATATKEPLVCTCFSSSWKYDFTGGNRHPCPAAPALVLVTGFQVLHEHLGTGRTHTRINAPCTWSLASCQSPHIRYAVRRSPGWLQHEGGELLRVTSCHRRPSVRGHPDHQATPETRWGGSTVARPYAALSGRRRSPGWRGGSHRPREAGPGRARPRTPSASTAPPG